MVGGLVEILRNQPEIALFLVLAIGHAVGQIRFGPIQLGGICGTLIAALVIGQLGIHVDDSVKNVFFMLFIFALGYAGGPQFFANLDAKGLRIGLLCLVEVVTVLVLVLLVLGALLPRPSAEYRLIDLTPLGKSEQQASKFSP